MDERLNSKIDAMDERLSGRMDAMDVRFNHLDATIANAKVWALTLYIALAAGMFGTMARGFGWV